MESVGEFFKQVREKKGLTVDEVVNVLRMRTSTVIGAAVGLVNSSR